MKKTKKVCKMICNTIFGCRQLAFISIIETLVDAAYIYVPLILLTPLIASIQNNNVDRVIKFGLYYILSKEILYLFSKFFQNMRINYGRIKNENDVNKFYNKVCRVPYETAKSTDFIQKSNNVANALYYEFDYNDIIDSGVAIIKDIINLICSCSLIVALVCAKPKVGNGIEKLISEPIISWIMVSIFLIIMYIISSKCNAKNMSKLNKLVPEHYSIENELAYYKNNIIYNYSAYISYKIYKMQRMLNDKIMKNTEDNVRFFMKTRNVSLKNNMQNNIIAGLVMIMSYSFTIIKIVTKAVSSSTFLTYSAGIMNVYTMCNDIQKQYRTLEHGLIYYDNIEDVMMEREERENDGIKIKPDTKKFVIEFCNVSYRYPGKKDYALKAVSFVMETGKSYALVGENGAGKSTIVHLICRFAKPTKGKILLNGKDIEEYDLVSYRSFISPVFQDISLYPVSLIENVTMDEKDMDESRIKNAMKKAGFEESGKYTMDSISEYRESEKYSGGERQKISIAQAFYRNASIYLMDEPNAALDPVSEAKLYDSITNISHEHMVMFISHRLSSCKICDNIIVIDKGKVIETGTHKELISNNGKYKAMWNVQAEQYKTANEETAIALQK